MALYENWKDMSVTKIAECLGVTKMSVTRCFDELEYLEMPVLAMKGKVTRDQHEWRPKRTMGRNSFDS